MDAAGHTQDESRFHDLLATMTAAAARDTQPQPAPSGGVTWAQLSAMQKTFPLNDVEQLAGCGACPSATVPAEVP